MIKKFYAILLVSLSMIACYAQSPCPTTVTADGVDYNVIRLDNQCWMAQNLRATHYADGTEITPAPMQYTSDVYSSVDYDQYGYLYTGKAATRDCLTHDGLVQGICPTGWHIPSPADIEKLAAVNARKLMAGSDWVPQGGSDDYSFNLLPSGYYNAASDRFEDIMVKSIMWSVTPGTKIYHACEFGAACGYMEELPGVEANGYAVRCVKDAVCGLAVKDHEGNSYNTVKIGNQCWMQENMRAVTSPTTGNYFIVKTTPSSSNYTYAGKQGRWYDNDSAQYAVKNYGVLYNWNAAMDTFNENYDEMYISTATADAVGYAPTGTRRGICPLGWHIPTDAEWTQLESLLTTADVTVNGDRGDHSVKLAGGEDWQTSTVENAAGDMTNADRNSSGFTALPAGSCLSSFQGVNKTAVFWTATQGGNTKAHLREMNYKLPTVNSSNVTKYSERSVRCVAMP